MWSLGTDTRLFISKTEFENGGAVVAIAGPAPETRGHAIGDSSCVPNARSARIRFPNRSDSRRQSESVLELVAVIWPILQLLREFVVPLTQDVVGNAEHQIHERPPLPLAVA